MTRAAKALGKQEPEILDDVRVTQKRAKLWISARDRLASKLGRSPSNEEMVDFAQTREGRNIRHLFPFVDVDGSARKWWVYLAGYYTRTAYVVLAGDGKMPEMKVRALHVVTEDGKKRIEKLDDVVATKSFYEASLREARTYLETFARKYENLARLRKDRKLVAAIEHVQQAIEALR
jgi:hypothetical protein